MPNKKYTQPRYTGQKSQRKFKGFGYYIHSNEKLTKKERRDVLEKSKIYLSEVYDSLPHDTETKMRMGIINELDSSLSDWELKDIWNQMYDNYGNLMSEFRDKWESEQLKGYNEETFKHSGEFEELEKRITELENEVMKLKTQLLKPKRGTGFG